MEQEGQRKNWLHRLHDWRKEHMSDKMFIIIMAFIVGLLSAFAAFILHGIINLIVALLTGRFSSDAANWLYLVYPVVGIYLTSLFVRYIVRDDISHGITRILYAISSNKSRLKAPWEPRHPSCSRAQPSARTSDRCSTWTARHS